MNVEVGVEVVCGVDAEDVGGVISETSGDINANVVCKGDADFGCAAVVNSLSGVIVEDVGELACERAASVSAAASITSRSPARSSAASRATPTASVKITRASASTSTARMWSFGKSGSKHVNAAPARNTPSCDAYKLAVSRGSSTATMDSFSCA